MRLFYCIAVVTNRNIGMVNLPFDRGAVVVFKIVS
jgi:hypothetical protein